MKHKLFGIFVLLIFSAVISCKDKVIIKQHDVYTTDTIYVIRLDTTSIKENIVLKDSIKKLNDSLLKMKDSKADLFVANYKLERIRYYNKVASKGKNLKFLRGWINRTLDEK